jgi:hypothetical protein
MLLISKKFFTSSNSFFWFPVIFVFLRLNSQTAELSYILIAAYAFLGSQHVIQSLILCSLFTILNSQLAPPADFEFIFRYFVILMAFLSIFFRTSFLKFDSFSLYTLFFAFFIVIHSIVFSYFPLASILKIFSWIVVMITLLKAWSDLYELEHQAMQDWIVKFLILIFIISTPTIFLKEIGYSVNASYFQGILAHPQVFGIVTGLMIVIFFGNLLKQGKNFYMTITYILFFIPFLFMSQSRTSGLAVIFAIGAFISYFLIGANVNKINNLQKYRIKKLLFVLLFLVLPLFFLFYEEIISQIYKFIIKRDFDLQLNNIFEVYSYSRGPLIEPMLENIKQNFIVGIGFNVTSDLDPSFIVRDSIFGLPISTRIEKGVIPLIILEEIGIIGFILFSIWILLIFKRTILNGIEYLPVLFYMLIINLGEGILFSVGGIGLLIIVLLTSFTTKPKLLRN